MITMDERRKEIRGKLDKLGNELPALEAGSTTYHEGIGDEPCRDVTKERIAEIKQGIEQYTAALRFLDDETAA
jgi:hypothetical protein